MDMLWCLINCRIIIIIIITVLFACLSKSIGWTSLVSTWMGDRLWAGKPSRYVTGYL